MQTDLREIALLDRRGTNSAKWDSLLATFGQEDLLPLWVADMDFKAPKCVRDALHQAVEQGAFGYYRVPDAYYENPTRYMLAAGVDSDNIGRCFRPFSADSGHHSAG